MPSHSKFGEKKPSTPLFVFKTAAAIIAAGGAALGVAYCSKAVTDAEAQKAADITAQWEAIAEAYPPEPGKDFLESIGYKNVNGGDADFKNCRNGRIVRLYNAQHESDTIGRFQTIEVCLGDNPPRLLYDLR